MMRLALGVLLVLVLAPLANVVATVPPQALLAALAAPDTTSALMTSLVASLVSVGLATLLGIPAGYLLARAARPARAAALVALALPLALPPVASGVALLDIVGIHQPLGALLAAHGLRVVDSFGGVVLAEFFVSGSIVAIAATAAFAAIDPVLEDAARTLGAGPARVLFFVALPLAAPGITAGALLAWLRALGEYGATSILAYHPISFPIQLVVALSANGVARSLALAEAFLVMTALGVVVVTSLRRPA